jgi:predicted membrane protein
MGFYDVLLYVVFMGFVCFCGYYLYVFFCGFWLAAIKLKERKKARNQNANEKEKKKIERGIVEGKSQG